MEQRKGDIKKNKYQPKGSMHPMDCSDIIIGMARGSFSKIYDAYTRDRSDLKYGHNHMLSSI